VNERVWPAVQKARAAGIGVAVCSGRPGFGVTRALAARVDPSGWHCFQNGASVVHLGSGQSRSAALSPNAVAMLVERARRVTRPLELYSDDDYVTEWDAEILRRHAGFLGEVLAAEPDLILDNGGDLFARYLDRPYPGLLGGTEETTSGRMRLEPLRGQLRRPILVINDSPIKQFAENEHAVGQSSVESFLRMTNRVTNGEQVTVFGYGACGRGVAANFRGAYARVSVVDVDPVTRLRAHLDGFSTPPRDTAVADADIIVTVTGARNVLTAADLPLLRDGVILANAGHFPAEIDAAGLIGAAEVADTTEYADDLLTLGLRDGRRVHLLARGHMFNLAGPRPLGNSIESMDLGFALQARCLEAVARRSVDATSCVVPVPGTIDATIAHAYLDRKYPS